MKRTALLFLFGFLAIQQNQAQENRAITTAVPFLLIPADARAAGMGDVGVATSPDAFSQQYNPAKFAFATEGQGISVSYTPYLTSLVNDINLGQLTYYNRLNERSAFAGTLRYFGLGDILLTESFDDPGRTVSPSELAVDVSYSLKLHERFSMGVAGRYIRSALKIPDVNSDASAANSFAFDIAGYYQSERKAYTNFDGRWRAGFNFQNIGPKMKYDNDEFSANFLPSNLKLGAGFDFIIDEFSTIGVTAEVNKLLVPSKPDYIEGIAADFDGDGIISFEEEQLANEKNGKLYNDYTRIGWTSGIFQSFNDAPGGFSEELNEFTYALGAEYWYQDSFALRLGYFNEHETKGARKYFTLGAGFKYNLLKIDVSYLMSTSKVQNPLENTLRFSLTFNFGDKKYDEI